MILIKKVRVKSFRSLRDQTLASFGNLTSLVGKNSSGKSNVLRALNLFFNNEVEAGKPLSLVRDYHEVAAARKKKRVEIEVEFTVPDNFNFRAQLEHLEQLGTVFSITRTWELDAQRRVVDALVASPAGGPVPGANDLARQFMSLISYRYIPNRTVPAALLRDESQALANTIFMRMKPEHGTALLEDLAAAAKRFLRTADTSMKSTGAPLSDATFATASSVGEMLTMAGFQAQGPTWRCGSG